MVSEHVCDVYICMNTFVIHIACIWFWCMFTSNIFYHSWICISYETSIVKLSLVSARGCDGSGSRKFVSPVYENCFAKLVWPLLCVYMCIPSLSVCHCNCKAQTSLCTCLRWVRGLRELRLANSFATTRVNDCSVQ